MIKSALDKIAKLNSIISPEKDTKTKSDLVKLDNVGLYDPVRYLKGVGPRISALLSRRKVERIEDL